MHSWLQFLGAGFVAWYGFDASHFQGFLLKVKLENQNLTCMKKPATYLASLRHRETQDIASLRHRETQDVASLRHRETQDIASLRHRETHHCGYVR